MSPKVVRIKDTSKVTRQKILVIGMVDSIHLARWLEQFIDQEIEFFIFPSKKFRKPHALLLSLIRHKKSTANYQLIGNFGFEILSGYVDYIKHEAPRFFSSPNSRVKHLTRVLKNNDFTFVHALELQGAGYLVAQTDQKLLGSVKFIATNWGSDIYYFKNFPEHENMIRRVLSIADLYSAECLRDYKLAREYGFKGLDLPCIPNAGGFEITSEKFKIGPTSDRRQIIIKGYGGLFGRADLSIAAIPFIAENFPEYSFFIYSVTPDVIQLIKDLPLAIQKKIRYSTVGKGVSRTQMMGEFINSRIYIGCSTSDGISTSFLEALINGTYPIQSGTSCANEWVQNGAKASIINLELSELLREASIALNDSQLVNDAALRNRNLAEEHLSKGVIRGKALTYYLN